MNNDVFVVSYPDDILQDGIRVICASLTPEQQQIVSTGLLQFDTTRSKVILYIWNYGTPIDWLLDKKIKSDIILFNSDADIEIITGYLAAHRNSYYFGNLKDLQLANNRAIHNKDDVLTLLEKSLTHYE